MDLEGRRKEILDYLRESRDPVTGSELAARFGVSRQAIVQDMAIIRAGGEPVLATPRGYLIPSEPRGGAFRAVVCCRHGRGQIEDEIRIVVDLGGKVMDVIVEHGVYGELRGDLMIASRRDLALFLDRLNRSEASPLSALTGGVHLHTLEAPDAAAMDEIIEALEEAGILLPG